MKMKAFCLFALSVLSLVCWLSAGSLLSSRAPKWLVAVGTAAWLFISTRALAATRVRHRAWIYADLFVLAVFSLLPFVLAYSLTDGLSSLGFGLFALSYPLAVLITMLLYIGVVSKTWQEAGIDQDAQAERKQSEWAMVIPVLSALTLVWWLFGSFVCGRPFKLFPWWLIALATVLLSVSALVLAARRVNRSVWVPVALLILAALFLPAPPAHKAFQSAGAGAILISTGDDASPDALCSAGCCGITLSFRSEIT